MGRSLGGRKRFVLGKVAAIGEFERGLVRERLREGREKAKARGVKFGAKPKLTSDEVQSLVQDFATPGLSKRELAELYGVGRQ